MTRAANAFGHRDELGFLTPRVAKATKSTPVIWIAVLMVATWIGACSLTLAISLGSVG